MSDEPIDSESKIRERAHALWEADGKQEGRGDEYWNRACEELQAEEPNDAEAIDK